MGNSTNKKLKVFLFLASITPVLMMTQDVFGAYWAEDKFTHFSREEPLGDVLKAMAENQGSNIIISNQVEGNINAYYRNKRTAEVFDNLKSTYNLVSYNDSDTLYVYTMAELQKVSIKMRTSPIRYLEQELLNIGVLNKKNKHKFGWKLNIKKNIVEFRAAPRFAEITKNIAYELENNNYIYKWKDKNNTIHYSNEPPFSGVKYLKVMKVEDRDVKEVPSLINESSVLSVDKKVTAKESKGSK